MRDVAQRLRRLLFIVPYVAKFPEGVTVDQLDAFVPHQANVRIVDAMAKQLNLPHDVAIARDIAYTGNTSAASVPLAMERMVRQGEIPRGGLALQIGFGAGLSYAAQVVVIP